MKNHSCPNKADELRARSEMRSFARLLLPIFEFEYQSQLTSPKPSWMYLTILERRMRQLEKQAQ